MKRWLPSAAFVIGLLRLGSADAQQQVVPTADDPPTPILERVGSMTVPGMSPQQEIELPRGRIAFVGYGPDGNSFVVHEIDGAGGTSRTSGSFALDSRLLAISADYVVAGFGADLRVLDWATGAVLANVPGAIENPAEFAEVRGGTLTIISPALDGGRTVGSLSEQYSLPAGQLLASRRAPFLGAFARRDDGSLFGVGARVGPGTAIAARFYDNLSVIAEQGVAPFRPRNNQSCGNVRSLHIREPYLVYQASCGDIRVLDLDSLETVATREAEGSDPHFVAFASRAGALVAASNANDASLRATAFKLPSLAHGRAFAAEVPADSRVWSSGDIVYVVGNVSSARPRVVRIEVYRVAESAAALSSLAASITAARRGAGAVFRESGDLYEALEEFERSASRLGMKDVESLPRDARRDVGWYAGMLSLTDDRRAEGGELLRSLLAAAPDDPLLRELGAAAEAWSSPERLPTSDRTRSVELPRAPLTLGALHGGAFAVTDRYVVVSRWCGTDPPPGAAVVANEDDALRSCFAGNAGIAVHAAEDLRLLRYVPIVASERESQQDVGSVVVDGDVAYVVVKTRYDTVFNVASVDLTTGAITAKAQIAEHLDKIGFVDGQLVVCGSSDGCFDVDRQSLAASERAPGLANLEPGDPFAGHRDGRIYAFAKAIAFPESRYAFVIGTRRGQPVKESLLLRLDRDTGRVVALADGRSYRLLPFGPYFVRTAGTALRFHDRDDGELVCAWPGIDALDWFATDKQLVIVGISNDATQVRPTRVFDAPKLLDVVKECGIATRAQRARLLAAIDALDRAE